MTIPTPIGKLITTSPADFPTHRLRPCTPSPQDAEVRLFTTPGMIPHWMLTAEGRCDDRRSAQLAVEPVTAGETYEYGYLNILDTTHLVGEGVPGLGL